MTAVSTLVGRALLLDPDTFKPMSVNDPVSLFDAGDRAMTRCAQRLPLERVTLDR
jgi:hypothetical protein